MTCLTVQEYQWLDLDPQEVHYLGSLAGHLPPGALEWGRGNRVRLAGFCGLVSLGGRMVEVLPKAGSRGALIRMIQRVYDLSITSWEGGLQSLAQGVLLDVFIAGFCRQLEDQLPRGLVHRYVDQQDDLTTLRGKLDLAAQLRRPPMAVPRLACRYSEFQVDNLVNRLIKVVLVRLHLWTRNPRLKAQVRILEGTFVDVSSVLPAVIPWETLTQDHTASAWKGLLTQCRWFLEGTSPNLHAGPQAGLNLLFDMEKLFEAFIAKELKTLFSLQGIQVLAQKPRKYLINDSQGKAVFQMKPDITLQHQGKNLAILDTKWKVLEEGKKQGVSQADLYQLFTYAKTYDVDQVALVYPSESLGKGARWEPWTYQDSGITLWIVRVDLGALEEGTRAFRERGLWDSITRFNEDIAPVSLPPSSDPLHM